MGTPSKTARRRYLGTPRATPALPNNPPFQMMLFLALPFFFQAIVVSGLQDKQPFAKSNVHSLPGGGVPAVPRKGSKGSKGCPGPLYLAYRHWGGGGCRTTRRNVTQGVAGTLPTHNSKNPHPGTPRWVLSKALHPPHPWPDPPGGGTPATTSTSSIHQLLGAADTQTAHHATFSTAPTHQRLGSANAETTPAGAPAAAADRTQRPNATCGGKNG